MRPDPSTSRGGGARSRGWVDPAWLFLLAGLAATASLVLIPAAESLSEARFQRDAALTWEHERLDRLARHEAYRRSILDREPATIRQLRILHLNQFPSELEPIGGVDFGVRGRDGPMTASIFDRLEPAPLPRPDPPRHRKERSRLAAWAVGERSRLWLAGAAGLCLLLGLLPGRRSGAGGVADRGRAGAVDNGPGADRTHAGGPADDGSIGAGATLAA